MSKQYIIHLSEEEREILIGLLDWWLEPMEDVTNETYIDTLLISPEQMLEAVDGMHYQFDLVTNVRARLQEVKPV